MGLDFYSSTIRLGRLAASSNIFRLEKGNALEIFSFIILKNKHIQSVLFLAVDNHHHAL